MDDYRITRCVGFALLTIGLLGTVNIGYQMYREGLFPWQWPQAEFENSTQEK